MTVYILITLALFVLQTYSEPSLRYLSGGKKGIIHGIGARDVPPETSRIGGRLIRASNNMKEALPVFLAVALLAEFKGATDGLTETGAMIFVLARILYVPAYLINIGPIRSITWSVAFAGMVLMVVGMWPALGL